MAAPAKPRPARGRRFHLPPGYSLAALPGRQYRFTRAAPPHASRETYNDPEAATRAAWEHAGLPVPTKVWEYVR